MNVMNSLNLFSGLSWFLFGMKHRGDWLALAAGFRANRLEERLAGNQFLIVLASFFVSAVFCVPIVLFSVARFAPFAAGRLSALPDRSAVQCVIVRLLFQVRRCISLFALTKQMNDLSRCMFTAGRQDCLREVLYLTGLRGVRAPPRYSFQRKRNVQRSWSGRLRPHTEEEV